MRVVVMVNPNATTTTVRTRGVLLAALHDKLAIESVTTDHRNHAWEIAAAARADGVDLVVAFGGDGTINEVINGLLQAGTGPDVPLLGIIPGGRTNVLSRNLGLPDNPFEAAGALIDGARQHKLRRIGLGRANERWFAFNAGLGLDAAVVAAVERVRERGRTATHGMYLRWALAEQVRTRRSGIRLRLVVPGQEVVEGLSLVLVANCSPWTYLRDRPVRAMPYASFDRGLDALGLRGSNPLLTLRHAVEVSVSGGGARGRDVAALHDRESFEVQADQPVPFQLDGDYLGDRAAVSFQSVANALTVVV